MAAVALVAAGCGAKGSDTAKDGGDGGGGGATTTVAGGGGTKFGTLTSPCGAAPSGKTVSIKADEAGGSAETWNLGVTSDRTAQIRPGLLKELYDTGVAFTEWCNEQGGIAGKKINLVDIDGQLLQVEAAATKACTGVFALVGGGLTQDNLLFSGKDGSDFHKCKLISFPGFAVSTEFSEANGVIQTLPNPAYLKSTTFMRDLAKKYPEEVKKAVEVFGEIPSIRINKDQNKATAATVPGFSFLEDIPYNIVGQDWSLIAQKVIQEGATAVQFIGEPENMSNLVAKLKEQNYRGIVFADANQYDAKLFSAGPDLADGVLVRVAVHPFEEASKWPAIQQYLDIMKKDPQRKIASLGIQGFSAWLLFASSINKCIADGNGEVTRECVIKAGKTFTSWDGGGLHAVGNPGEGQPPKCSLIMQAGKGGTFKRFWPEPGSAEDKDGFSCYDDANAKITGDFGQGKVDSSRPF